MQRFDTNTTSLVKLERHEVVTVRHWDISISKRLVLLYDNITMLCAKINTLQDRANIVNQSVVLEFVLYSLYLIYQLTLYKLGCLFYFIQQTCAMIKIFFRTKNCSILHSINLLLLTLKHVCQTLAC